MTFVVNIHHTTTNSFHSVQHVCSALGVVQRVEGVQCIREYDHCIDLKMINSFRPVFSFKYVRDGHISNEWKLCNAQTCKVYQISINEKLPGLTYN